jgi:transcriptional regulatory protein LevR
MISFQETHLCNISRVAERIFMKLDIKDFHQKKNKFTNILQNQFYKAVLQYNVVLFVDIYVYICSLFSV